MDMTCMDAGRGKSWQLNFGGGEDAVDSIACTRSHRGRSCTRHRAANSNGVLCCSLSVVTTNGVGWVGRVAF